MSIGRPWKRLVLVLLFVGGGALLLIGASVLLNSAVAQFADRPAESSAVKIFRQYVLNPIPESVTEIKADQPKSFGGYGYVLRFAISRPDLDLIIKSRPFREARIVGCSAKTLLWGWKNPRSSESVAPFAGGFNVYQPQQRKPAWFDVATWGDPNTYVVDREDKKPNDPDTEILIYNGQLGQAYFIVFDYGGDAMWN